MFSLVWYAFAELRTWLIGPAYFDGAGPAPPAPPVAPSLTTVAVENLFAFAETDPYFYFTLVRKLELEPYTCTAPCRCSLILGSSSCVDRTTAYACRRLPQP